MKVSDHFNFINFFIIKNEKEQKKTFINLFAPNVGSDILNVLQYYGLEVTFILWPK